MYIASVEGSFPCENNSANDGGCNCNHISCYVNNTKDKSSYIFELSKIIIEKSKIPLTKEKLIELPGVGNKIAGVFIINAKLFDKNIKEFDFPVDTHIKQFSSDCYHGRDSP